MSDAQNHVVIVSCQDAAHATKVIKWASKLDLVAVSIGLPFAEAPASKPTKPGKKKLPPVTATALKEILTRVKDELGSDVLKNIFVTHDCKSLKALPEEEWPTVYAEAEALLDTPAEEEDEEMDAFDLLDDEEDDDDLGLDDDDEEDDDDLGLDSDDEDDAPDLATVKTYASRYSDKHGLDAQREVLAKHGIPTTRSLGKATPEQLSKIFAGFKKGLK